MRNKFRIIGFGDSITLGAKATMDEYNWLGVLEHQWRYFFNNPVEVINKGVGDNTISPRTTNYDETTKPSALERTQDDVIHLNPDLILICFGLNDMRLGTPIEVFSEDLEKIIIQIKSACPEAIIILTNVFHMTGWGRYFPRDRGSIELTKIYNEAIGLIGEKHHIPVADVSGAMAFKDYLINEDGVHANDLGHRIIGNRVFETIARHTQFLNGNIEKDEGRL